MNGIPAITRDNSTVWESLSNVSHTLPSNQPKLKYLKAMVEANETIQQIVWVVNVSGVSKNLRIYILIILKHFFSLFIFLCVFFY